MAIDAESASSFRPSRDTGASRESMTTVREYGSRVRRRAADQNDGANYWLALLEAITVTGMSRYVSANSRFKFSTLGASLKTM
jgi:hypothetical protein